MGKISEIKEGIKNKYFYPLDDLTACKKVTTEVGIAFYFIAAIDLGCSFLPYPGLKDMYLDGLLFLNFALYVHIIQSRIAAILLFLLTGTSLVITVLNKIGILKMGGHNIFLAVVLFLAAYRGVEATFTFHALKNRIKII